MIFPVVSGRLMSAEKELHIFRKHLNLQFCKNGYTLATGLLLMFSPEFL